MVLAVPACGTLVVSASADGAVVRVQLNRPKTKNAMTLQMWRELGDVFRAIDADADVRVVVVSGAGGAFSSGLDLNEASSLLTAGEDEGAAPDAGRRALRTRAELRRYQDPFSVIEHCRVPVIAAIAGVCIGGGLDLAAACCVRVCTDDTRFSLREVAIGMAADLGSLQRLPRRCGNDSLLREIAYTARFFQADEALRLGLVSRVLKDDAALASYVDALALEIAGKSPIAVIGTKHNLQYSLDHPTQDALAYMATWNSCMLQSGDMLASVGAMLSRQPAQYARL